MKFIEYAVKLYNDISISKLQCINFILSVIKLIKLEPQNKPSKSSVSKPPFLFQLLSCVANKGARAATFLTTPDRTACLTVTYPTGSSALVFTAFPNRLVSSGLFSALKTIAANRGGQIFPPKF